MLEIIFAACSIVHGSTCRDIHLTFDQDPATITAFQCGLFGQFHIAEWQSTHPNWYMNGGYTCRPAGQIAKA